MKTAESFDMFLHGGDYPDTKGVPRDNCCATCAFSRSADSVRPKTMTIDDLVEATWNFDDFVCHMPTEDGRHLRCAGWHARVGERNDHS